MQRRHRQLISRYFSSIETRMSYEPWNPERAAEIVAEFAGLEGALLPILHALQHAFGHVPSAAVPIVAGALNLSRADVHGVVTFYHDYRSKLAGKHVLKLCRAEACQARGADAVLAEAENELGISLGKTTANGQTTFEAVYCLGLCASGPSAMLDGRIYGRVSGDRLTKLLAEAQA